MLNPLTIDIVSGVVENEIVPSLDVEGGAVFARQVIERFSNPFLRHRLIDITLQSTSKWRLRLIPSLLGFVEKEQRLPRYMCLGFAAYLVFMRATTEKDGAWFGEYKGKSYPIRDDHAGYFYALWESVDPHNKTYVESMVSGVCAHEEFWGQNLNKLDGFVESVAAYVLEIMALGAEKTLRNFKAVAQNQA